MIAMLTTTADSYQSSRRAELRKPEACQEAGSLQFERSIPKRKQSESLQPQGYGTGRRCPRDAVRNHVFDGKHSLALVIALHQPWQ